MNLPAINGPSAAFIAGAITSIHCLGMCGPLACYLAGGNQQRRTVYLSTVTYHGGRILSYTFLGALAGGLGKGLSQWFPFLSGNWLPWAFILFFLLLILGLEKKFQPSAGLVGRCLGALQARAARMHPVARSGLVGLGTPSCPVGLSIWSSELPSYRARPWLGGFSCCRFHSAPFFSWPCCN
jgi:sulfite exporter TauE/SafE